MMTDAQRSTALWRYLRGDSPVAIAASLGVSRWAVLRAARAAGHALQTGGKPPVPMILREAIVEMARTDGAVAAARAFGINRVTVWRLGRLVT